MNLIDELKRRKVLQTAAIYVAVAWGATEIVITIEEKFALPEWVSQVALLAFIVGFPVTILASWYVDISARGFRATTPGKPLGSMSVAVLVVLTAAATFLLWALISPEADLVEECPQTDPFCSARASLAVLPFDNLTGAADNDFAAIGLSEDLISLLARISKLRVAAGRSAVIASESGQSFAEIGESLGVDNILEGRLQRGSDGLVIVAQLVDARSQSVFWTRQFNVESGLIAAREAVSMAVADALRLDAATSRADSQPTSDDAAYEAYLRGLKVSRVQGYGSPDSLQHFTLAVNLDPEFADAHVALAGALIEMADSGLIGADEALTKATAAVDRAIRLNPQLSGAYTMLGQLRRRRTETGGALDALTRALELNPNDEVAHLEVGRLLRNQGQLAAANREFEIAFSLDPLNQLLDTYRIDVLQKRGDYAGAIRQLKDLLVADPGSSLLYGNLQIQALLSGGAEASLRFAEEAELADASSGWNGAFQAMAETRLGRADAARETIRRFEQREPGNYFLRTAKLMRLAADGDAAGLRAYAESLLEDGGNRSWYKWSGLGALMEGDNLAAAEHLEAAFQDLDWYSSIFPAEEIVHMSNLVVAYRYLGDADKADEWLRICSARVRHLREQGLSLPDLDYAEGALVVLRGDPAGGVEYLRRAAMRGWLGWPAMRHDPKLHALDGDAAFAGITAGP